MALHHVSCVARHYPECYNTFHPMATLTVLVKGYARRTGPGGFIATPNTVLLRDSGRTVLVDPGANPGLLIEAMGQQGVTAKDIDLIVITHYHMDHILNIRLFPGVDICDGAMLYRDDVSSPVAITVPGTNVTIFPTPGHSPEHISLLVDTARGREAIAGDLFWWEDGRAPGLDRESLLALEDPFATDPVALRNSRGKLLARASFIIPGHGEPFAAPHAAGEGAAI